MQISNRGSGWEVGLWGGLETEFEEGKVWSRVASKAKCRDFTTALESVIGMTHFRTGVSWHFHSVKDQGLKIELAQLL